MLFNVSFYKSLKKKIIITKKRKEKGLKIKSHWINN